MIDLHTHLLPGIDDGPNTLEESLELCRLAVEGGTSHAICTPHVHPGRWNNTATSIQRETANLCEALKENDITLELGFAGEVRLSDDILHLVATEKVPFYGQVDGYRVMLLEFPHGHIVPGSEKLIRWLMDEKIRPLIAHPERNKQVMKNFDALAPFLEAGCWVQLTAGSIVGDFGEAAQKTASQLLMTKAATAVASDGHNAGARRPVLKAAFEYISKHYGEDVAAELMLHAPLRIVASQFEQGLGCPS